MDEQAVGLRSADEHAFHAQDEFAQAADLDEFVACYNPSNRHERKATWNEENADGRWRCFDYEDLLKRDKLNLDIFWLKDKSLEDSENLPEPDVLAQEIIDDLEDALMQLRNVGSELR